MVPYSIADGGSASAIRAGLNNQNARIFRREYFPTIANNSTDAEHDLDIGAARLFVEDGSGNSAFVEFAALTKRIDATWVAGTNQGGLDTGSPANSTWYYIWAIWNPTSGVADYLISTSATSPTMPSGYTYKRRVLGALRTDGSANILGFRQIGSHVHFNTAIVDFNASTNPGTITVSVPPIAVLWDGWVQIQGDQGQSADVRPVGLTNVVCCIARVQTTAQFAAAAGQCPTSTGQLSLVNTATTACTLRTNGFTDLGV